LYKIIRCGSGYDLVIVVSPSDASPESEEAKYFRFATWKVDGYKPHQFHMIEKDAALGYFSGHADGLGYENVPSITFTSLDEILKFIMEARQSQVPEFTQIRFLETAKRLYHPPLPYHNFSHARQVLTDANVILRRCHTENVPVNDSAVVFAALAHDWGYALDHTSIGFATKEALAAFFLGRALENLGVNEEIIKLSEGAVLGTAMDAAVISNEAKVLRAADLAGLAKDLPTFVHNNQLLKEEAELLSGKKISWSDWKTGTQKIVEFFLSQDIRLTSYHDDEKGNSRFHLAAQKILDEFMALPESELTA